MSRLKTVKTHIMVDLKNDELIDRTRLCAKAYRSLTAHLIQEKQVKENLKDKRETLQKEQIRLLQIVDSGQEQRMVECSVIYNDDQNEVQYIHKGNVVETRAMTNHDKQMTLDETPSPTPKPVKKKQAVKSKNGLSVVDGSKNADKK